MLPVSATVKQFRIKDFLNNILSIFKSLNTEFLLSNNQAWLAKNSLDTDKSKTYMK